MFVRLSQLVSAGKVLLLLAANGYSIGRQAPVDETCEAGIDQCSICQVNPSPPPLIHIPSSVTGFLLLIYQMPSFWVPVKELTAFEGHRFYSTARWHRVNEAV